MRYYKNIDENNFVSINTLNTDGDGNITEIEYETIKQMIIEKPEGKRVFDNEDGTYSYKDIPSIPESEPTEEDFAQAGRILMGMN